MKISVIVPVYNVENYLEECLESIINQTYKNLEIILINDGSTDNSLKICKRYKQIDNRIILINKKNEGVSVARNIGIETATGDYISFVDSDDVIHKNYISFLCKKNSYNILNICNKEIFLNIIPKTYEQKYKSYIYQKKDQLILVKHHLLNQPVGKLYSADIIRKNNIKFETNLSLGEDLLFNLDYLKYINNINIITNKLYYYRHGNRESLSSKYRDDMIDIQLNLLNRYKSFFCNVPEEYKKIYNDEILGFIGAIVINELKNKKIKLLKRITILKKFLNQKHIKNIINDSSICTKKIKYYLLKYKILIPYYLRIKFKKI